MVWSSAEVLPESAGAPAEAPATPARWEESLKSTVRVGGYASLIQAALMVNVLNGRKLGAG